MAKRKKAWRCWAIVCKGVGPISGRVYMSRSGAAIAKRFNWSDNDLYEIKRAKLSLDPVKRRATKRR